MMPESVPCSTQERSYGEQSVPFRGSAKDLLKNLIPIQQNFVIKGRFILSEHCLEMLYGRVSRQTHPKILTQKAMCCVCAGPLVGFLICFLTG